MLSRPLAVEKTRLEADVARTVKARADMLTSLDCEVIVAGNGTEALAKRKADDRIEILMTDINMPGLGAKRLRPGLHVILVSGVEADGHGMPFIRKPLQESDIARVM